MNWTPALIETWAIEAALVEMSLPNLKRNGLQQPSSHAMHFRNYQDRRFELNAQAQLRFEEGVEGRPEFSWGNPKAQLNPSAITRRDEFIFLVATHLPKRRGRLKTVDLADCMWAWAFSMAGSRTSFRRFCRNTGRPPSSAIRIKNHATKFLAEQFFLIPQKKFLTEVEQIRQKWSTNQIGSVITSSPAHIINEYPTKSDYSDPLVVKQLERAIRRANKRVRRMKRRK